MEADPLRRESELDARQREGTTPDQIEITHYGDGTTIHDRALEDFLKSGVEAEAAPGGHLYGEVPPARPVRCVYAPNPGRLRRVRRSFEYEPARLAGEEGFEPSTF